MAQLEIIKLRTEIPDNSFKCGNSSIDSLIRESYYPTVLQHAFAFEFSVDKHILGYYMIKFLKINLDNCPDSIADYKSHICEDCYSVHIKYLAVDSKYQKKGIGKNVLGYIIDSVLELCVTWPIRLITLDAIKEKYEWYKERGFVAFQESDLENDSPTILMYMDCLLNHEILNDYIKMA